MRCRKIIGHHCYVVVIDVVEYADSSGGGGGVCSEGGGVCSGGCCGGGGGCGVCGGGGVCSGGCGDGGGCVCNGGGGGGGVCSGGCGGDGGGCLCSGGCGDGAGAGGGVCSGGCGGGGGGCVCSADAGAGADTTDLPENEFHYIRDYIAQYETKYLRVTMMSIGGSQKRVIGIRFDLERSNAATIFTSVFGQTVSFTDVISGVASLQESQVDQLFEADLPYYIDETRSLVDNFDSYPMEVKAVLVDSHFIKYPSEENQVYPIWNAINDPAKNWVQKCMTYTRDPNYAETNDEDFRTRLRRSCGLLMDYARTIGDSNSTYDPCTNDLMYPYGVEVGDFLTERSDDGSSGEILLSIPFPFFDYNHHSLWVNTNGVISFLTNVWHFQPAAFPLANDIRLVAPFWADVDTRNGGEVYYREITNPEDVLLERATMEIQDIFPEKFSAIWLLVATWDNVAFYGAAPTTGVQKRNTFQCILATNGKHSFAIFNYHNITWTTGTTAAGDEDTGLGGIPAQVGFNAGDGVTFKVVNNSRTDAIVDIDTWTDGGTAVGRFVFRIDNKQVTSGGCNNVGVLSVYPTFGYMLGGQTIKVSGPCFDDINNPKIYCRFGEHEVRGTKESSFTASCNTPIFYEVGRLAFEISIDNRQTYDDFTGIFTVVSEEYRKPNIRRVDADNWIENDDVTIEWTPGDIADSSQSDLRVSLYAYVENSNTVEASLQWIDDLSSGTKNTGTMTFNRLQVNSDDYHVGVIRISDAETDFDDHPKSIWSDIHSLKWKYNVDAYSFCKDWSNSAKERDITFLTDLEACPCTLRQARVDTGRFTAHPTCNERSDHADNCNRNPSAKHCVRVNQPSDNGAGQQCCYDNDGNLINGPDNDNSGGTSHRRHHGGVPPFKSPGKVPYLSHYLYDILPWEHCCVYSSIDLCYLYYKKRPSDDCRDYVPPRPGGGVGDPHLITFDGFKYTFNGHGEFHLIQTLNNTFSMQGRMQTFKVLSGTTVEEATAFTAIAMQGGTSDAVQIEVNERRRLDAWVRPTGLHDNSTNWEFVDFEEYDFWTYKDVSLIKDNIGNSSILTVIFKNGVSVQATATEGLLMMSFMFFGTPQLKNTTSGLMGTWNDDPDDDLMTPEWTFLSLNSSLRDIHYSYGLTWNVSEDRSLFRYDIAESYTSINQYDYIPILDLPDVPDDVVDMCDGNDQCIFDYQMTGSDEIALVSKGAVAMYETLIEDTVKVVSCGFHPSLSNGSKTVSRYTEGGIITFTCNDGYGLYGSKERTCQSDGTWSGVQPSCSISDCGLPGTIEGGITNLSCTEYLCTVDYYCQTGYTFDGRKTRTCQRNGVWDGESPTCTGGDAKLEMWMFVVVIGGVGLAVLVTIILALIWIIMGCFNKRRKRCQMERQTQYRTHDTVNINRGFEPETPLPESEYSIVK
ncbi:protein mesh-like [Glandiceps talaboti]